MSGLSGFDRSLINKHFEYRELQRQYDVAGIHGLVQHFIDSGGLEEARARHDDTCEMRDGFRRWCACAERRNPAAFRMPVEVSTHHQEKPR